MPTETDEAKSIAATLREELETEPDVIAAYLYGSVASGTQRRDSDVDLALLLQQDPPDTLEGFRLDLAARLQSQLGRQVQVAVLNRAPCDLAHRVRRDGHLLIEHDRSRRVAREVKSRNEYFDTEPIRRLYRHGSTS